MQTCPRLRTSWVSFPQLWGSSTVKPSSSHPAAFPLPISGPQHPTPRHQPRRLPPHPQSLQQNETGRKGPGRETALEEETEDEEGNGSRFRKPGGWEGDHLVQSPCCDRGRLKSQKAEGKGLKGPGGSPQVGKHATLEGSQLLTQDPSLLHDVWLMDFAVKCFVKFL